MFLDDVIRKRLLFEAEGTSGDDRRINTLLKTFMRWCNAKDSGVEERYHEINCTLVLQGSLVK